MHTISRLKLEAARRALAYCGAHPDPNPAAAPSVARLEALLALAASREEAQGRSRREAANARDERDLYLVAIRLRTADLIRLAGSVAAREGIPQLSLRIPRDTRNGRRGFLAEVRQALTLARRHEDLLRNYGLPAAHLGELEGDLMRCELAERRRAGCEADRVEATRALAELAREAYQLLRHLDALNRLRFAGDTETTGSWRAASAVHWQRRVGGPALRAAGGEGR